MKFIVLIMEDNGKSFIRKMANRYISDSKFFGIGKTFTDNG